MAQNFISCDRDQQLLMPPDLHEWLPKDHLAWFVLESVGEMDLSRFYAAYRDDGWGRAAYEPSMMVALLLYAYCKGERSARKIEERCTEDIGYRVICANNVPDHVTINRFRFAHAEALAASSARCWRCARGQEWCTWARSRSTARAWRPTRRARRTWTSSASRAR